MQVRTFGTWTGSISGIGAGALTASPDYSFLAIYVFGISATVWIALLLVFVSSNWREIVSGRKKLGSWYFIVPCFALALLAIGGAAYGLGLRSASIGDGSGKGSGVEGAVSSTSKPPSLPNTAYTKDDVARLLEATHAAHEFINGEPVKVYERLFSLRDQWNNQITRDGPDHYISMLNSGIGETNAATLLLNDFLYKKYAYYSAQMRIALSVDDYPNGLVPAMVKMTEGVNLLPKKNPETNSVSLLNDRFEIMDGNILKWRAWIDKANDRIALMTTNLREKGVTGFEKK